MPMIMRNPEGSRLDTPHGSPQETFDIPQTPEKRPETVSPAAPKPQETAPLTPPPPAETLPQASAPSGAPSVPGSDAWTKTWEIMKNVWNFLMAVPQWVVSFFIKK